MNKRLVYLDIIRVIACLMVIIMHSPIAGEMAEKHGPFLSLISYLTAPCVPLFFMVSGALLLGGAARKMTESEGQASLNTFAWLGKRIGKILGPTVCFSLFYIALNSGNVFGDGQIRALLSIPFSAQGHGILWFMYTLTGLYLLTPVLAPWLGKASKNEVEFYLGVWFITLLYPYIGLALDINTGDTGVLYYFSGYAGFFLLGYYLMRWPLSRRGSIVVVALALFMLPLPLLNKMFGWNLDFYTAFWYLSAPVMLMTTAWFVAVKSLFDNQPSLVSSSPSNPEKPSFAVRALVSVSNLSFGIYLIHIFVMRTLLWQWAPILHISNYYLQTALVAFLTFAGSFLICRFIAILPLSQYVIGYSSRRK